MNPSSVTCGAATFSDELPEPDYKLPIETRLIKYLRVWRVDPNAVVEDGRSVESALEGVLEWFICQCLEFSPEREVRDWWSDGVIDLRITQTSDESFRLLGVTWIGSEGIAPFEIEAMLDSYRDDSLAKCVFRIGARDDHGRAVVFDRDMSCQRILDKRPKQNADWATAIELTPNDRT